MLYRFADPIDIDEGTQRRERYTMGTVARTAFSVTTLGITAYSAMGIYMHTRKSWDEFPVYLRRVLQRPFPWERSAQDTAAGYTTQSVYSKPQSILQLADRYDVPSRVASRELINRGTMMEIHDLEEYLDRSDTTRMYLQQARLLTFRSKDLVTGGSVEDLVWSYPDAARRYKEQLRKYKAIYDRIDPQVREEVSATTTVGEVLDATGQMESLRGFRNTLVNDLHRKALRGKQYVPTEFDFSEVRYQPIQMGPRWGIDSRGRFDLRKLLVDAERGGVLSWEDRKLYTSNPQYMHLNIANTENALNRVYTRLRSELSNRAQSMMAPNSNTPLDQLYRVEPQILNYGDGSLAIRLLLRLKNEGMDQWSTDEVVLPLGNMGNVQFSMGGARYVGALYRRSGSTEYLTPAVQFAQAVERKASNIVNDLAQDTPGRSGWKNDAINSTMRRVTMAQGKLVDRGVRLAINDEDIMRLNPAYNWAEGERRELQGELTTLRSQLRSLGHSTSAAGKIEAVRDRIELVKKQLGEGYTVPEQLLELHRRMGRMIDEEGTPIPYYWERGATHAGSLRYVTIFGDSPFALEANPQASVYQFYNLYELRPEIRTSYPIRYGDGSLVHKMAEQNFLPARAAFAGNLYPFSESEVLATSRFYERITGGRVLGTGDPRSRMIPIYDDKVSINSSQVELSNLIEEVRRSAPDRMLNADAVHGIVSAGNVELAPSTILSVDRNGVEIKSPNFRTVVTDVVHDPTSGNLVLRLEQFAPAARLRSLAGARGVMRQGKIRLASTSLDINRPMDYIIKGSIGNRITHRMVESMVLGDAIESVKFENRGLLRVMQGSRTSRINRSRAAMRYRFNVAKLRAAATELGGRYTNRTQEMLLPGVFSQRGFYSYLHSTRPEVADKVLRVLGRVYRPDDPTMREMSRVWDTYGQAWAKYLEAPPEWVERMRPRPWGPARFGIVPVEVAGVGTVRLFTPVGLDLAGLMRQSHAEMVKAYGLKTGVDAGIPYRYTELPLLLDRLMKVPEPIREPMLSGVERYVAYLTSQMGGPEASDEYNKILMQIATMEPPAMDKVIRLGTKGYQDFMEATSATFVGGGRELGREAIYMIEGRAEPAVGVEGLNLAQIARTEGKVVTEVPTYKVRPQDLGIFAPARGYLGAWVELPEELEVEYAGILGRTRFLRIPDPTKLKVQPTEVPGPGGPYVLVPQYYRNLSRILAEFGRQEYTEGILGQEPVTGYRAGVIKSAQWNFRKMVDAAMEERLIGKRSWLRMHEMMAYEPGLQMTVMSMPSKVTWGRETLQLADRGPTDIVVAGKHFNRVEEVIRQNLLEKHMDLPYEEATAATEAELGRIRTGKEWWPVPATRFPIASPMARSYGRLFFEPKLNRMGDFSDYMYLGDLIQKATWGDFDFDIYDVALAKHYKGTEGLMRLITAGADRAGDARIWEGTPEFAYATGMEVYGSGKVLDSYTDEIKAVVGGRIETIKIPKVFRFKSVDKGVGYHIEVYKPKYDDVNKAYYITNERDIFRYRGQPVFYQPGEWMEVLEDSVRRGVPPNATQEQLIRQLDPTIKSEWVASGKWERMMRTVFNAKRDMYMGLIAQKGFVGHATAYAMAMNLLATEHLPPSERAALSTSLGWWIQNVLQAKKWKSGQVMNQLHRYGTFTRAIQNIRTVDDIFGQMLTGAEEAGGWAMPAEAARAVTMIPLAARRRWFPRAGIGYDLLHRAVAAQGAEGTLRQLLRVIGTSEAGNTVNDIAMKSGLGELINKLNIQDTVQDPWATRVPTGYFKRKPFIGPLFRRTKTQDTMLADAVGADWATGVRAGLVGAGVLGGLYLAFNFFRPNQMATLGTMPGLGGEFWGPRRGGRMELPWRMPIDVDEYTWRAPPYNRRKARVEMYNPITAEKLALLPTRMIDALTPITDWTVAPQAEMRYNNYNRQIRPFTLQEAIRSSKVILAR